VHGVMAIGLLFAAPSLSLWVGLVAAGSAVALPAVLLWLLALCALSKPLQAAHAAVQWAAAVGFGGVAAFVAARGVAMVLPDAASVGLGGLVGAGPALAGAAIGATIFEWLLLRARATLPAETTARLAELQSRIRPHFLFNTLNTAL